MEKHLGLSDIEFDLMSFFWSQAESVSFGDILRFCNDVKGWGWAKTTAHTYVTRLMQKNLLGVNQSPGIRRTYFAKVSHEELACESAQEFVNSSFSGSVKNLLLSLVPNMQLTQDDANELHKILDQLAVSNDADSSQH